MRNVLIVAGGTGGHISPGIALFEELNAYKKKYQIKNLHILSLERNKENPDFKKLENKSNHNENNNINLSNVSVIFHNSPMFTKNLLLYFYKFIINLFKVIFVLNKLKVTDIICMGGYSTLPVIIYSLFFKTNLYLCEQNVIPGKVTKYFRFKAKNIAYSFPPLFHLNSNEKILGNPIRKMLIPKNVKKTSGKTLNVLVLGGSQGARQINNMVLDFVNNSEFSKYYKFTIITGDNLYKETIKKNTKTKKNLTLIPYLENLSNLYKNSNLVICRSGAGVISECSLYGLPMILIPYPFAADNHQKYNADYFTKHHAAIAIQNESEDRSELEQVLKKILHSKMLLKELGNNSKKLSKRKATQDTIAFFFNEIK